MQLLQAIIDGILLGGVYAVISIGLTLVFGVIGIVNFAQAQFMMIGMFIAYYCWRYLGLDPLIGSVFSFVGVFLIGVLVQRLIINRVIKAPVVAQIFLTVGLLIVLENGALILFGSDFRTVHTSYQTSALRLGQVMFNVPYLLAFAISLMVGLALWLVMNRTWWGKAVRATAEDPSAAQLVGIAPSRIYQSAFGLGVGLTALGGAIILPFITVSPTAGDQFAVLMFTVVVLGGLGNVLGAVVGGIAAGLIQSLSALVLPIQLQNFVLFVVFILVLALRPEGLLGRGR